MVHEVAYGLQPSARCAGDAAGDVNNPAAGGAVGGSAEFEDGDAVGAAVLDDKAVEPSCDQVSVDIGEGAAFVVIDGRGKKRTNVRPAPLDPGRREETSGYGKALAKGFTAIPPPLLGVLGISR